MRGLLLVCLLAASAAVPTGTFGAFTNAGDVGAPPIKGSAQFDPATGQYRVTGSGRDIWGASDEFHFVWREVAGSFAVTATATFLTGSVAHRKAVVMLRESLDADSPFVHLAIHGDGLPAVQSRTAKGDTVNTVDFPIQAAGTWTLKMARDGTTITVWLAKDGAPLRELGHTLTRLRRTALVGLGVSSHTRDATCTVSFSDVSVELIPKRP